jgi:hypothetical protein
MQMSCWSHVVFWVVMMLCSRTDGCQVKMEAAYSPGMLVNTYVATQSYNPEGQSIFLCNVLFSNKFFILHLFHDNNGSNYN